MTARRTGAASALALTGLTLILGLVHLIAPRWTKQVGLDLWNLAAVCEERRATDEETIEVQAKQERMFHQIALTDNVALRVIDGSLTLAAAVDELEPLFRDQPCFAIAFESYQPPTYRHGIAQYIIRKVRHQLEDDPSRCDPVCARLEAEYASIR